MSIKLTWKTDPDYSSLHAAAAVCSNSPLLDAHIKRTIGDPAAQINDRLAVADVDTDRFWASLIALGSKGKTERGRVEIALLAAGCGELAADSIAPTIAGQLADLKIAFAEAYPKLSEQLPLRARPLQEQWEAKGPGLIAVIGKLTHPDLMPKKATIALVQPVLGGSGGANPDSGIAWIEAVLANPIPEIPEVLRLGWLIARLGLGRTEASKLVDAEHLPNLAALALLPIMVKAGEELELISTADLPVLFDAWNIRRIAPPSSLEHLQRWWAQLSDGDTPFPVGIKALDRMLST